VVVAERVPVEGVHLRCGGAVRGGCVTRATVEIALSFLLPTTVRSPNVRKFLFAQQLPTKSRARATAEGGPLQVTAPIGLTPPAQAMKYRIVQQDGCLGSCPLTVDVPDRLLSYAQCA
jgi:hypothetical protein